MSKNNKMSQIIEEGMDKYMNKDETSFEGDTAIPKSVSTIKKGGAFLEYYVREIARHTNYLMDEDSINKGLDCNGKYDMGIDFIYQFGDGRFWIVQSKYRSGQSLNNDEIAGFFDLHNKVFLPDERESAKRTVRELLRDMTPESPITYVLLTNKKATSRNKTIFERLNKTCSDKYGPEKVQWILTDLPKIESDYKEIIRRARLPKIDIAMTRSNKLKLPVYDDDKKYTSIVTVIRGDVLYKWCNKHKSKLFVDNIRGFLGGKSKTNRQIKTTLGEKPNLFYLYNNGISATCMEMTMTAKKLTCHGFQIINGAQTVWSIGNFWEIDSKEKLKKVKVLLRITETGTVRDPLTGTTGLDREMIEFNNTQNAIQDSDFRSNDSIQMFLKEKFKTIKYKATSLHYDVVYAPKRQDSMFYPNTPKSKRAGKIFVSLDSLAKSLYAFEKDTPGKINSISDFLFDEIDRDGYWSLFGEINGLDIKKPKTVSGDKFEKFAAVAILNYFLECELKKKIQTTDSDSIDGMVARVGRLFLWAFGYIIKKHYKESESKVYQKIIDGKAFESRPQEESFVSVLFAFIHEQFHIVLSFESENIKRGSARKANIFNDNGNGGKKDAKALNFKTWLRDDKKMDFIRERMDYIAKHRKLPKI